MDIPALRNKKSHGKRKRPTVPNVLPRKSERLALEAADSSAGGQEAEDHQLAE